METDGISVDSRIMGGVPCIAGTRIPVATIVGIFANGMTMDEILTDFPQLGAEAFHQSLNYAARLPGGICAYRWTTA